MNPKTTLKENLSRYTERGWHGRASRHGGTMPKIWHNRPRPAQAARACHLARPSHAIGWFRPVVPVSIARLCYPCLTPWDFRATLFCGFKLASLALLSAKYRPSFCLFDKVPKYNERCYISKMYTKGGRFDHSLTRSKVKTREKKSQIGAKIGSK